MVLCTLIYNIITLLRLSICVRNDGSDEESYVVGWPPIKSSRKKELHIQQYHIGGQIINKRPSNTTTATYKKINNTNTKGSAASNYNSMYVKVKMEGVAIARKIDLSLHHSYPTLKNTLITMFTNSKYILASFIFILINLYLYMYSLLLLFLK